MTVVRERKYKSPRGTRRGHRFYVSRFESSTPSPFVDIGSNRVTFTCECDESFSTPEQVRDHHRRNT